MPKTKTILLDGKITKKIYLLSNKKIKNYILIGVANGQDFDHCLYLGMRHAKNFFERVVGYIARNSKSEEYQIEVYFYENKTK